MKTPAGDPGEYVEVSVTHEVKISGDKAWIGTRRMTMVQDNETPQDAYARANADVQTSVMRTIQNTVETVERFTS